MHSANLHILLQAVVVLLIPVARSQWLATPFNVPSLPLAVRNPYFNSWRPLAAGPEAVNVGATYFWAGIDASTQITDWFALVKVDGTTYRVVGTQSYNGTVPANQTASILTPTRATFVLTCGPVEVNATFLNPIEPNDLVRLSMPFSYLYMSAQSIDGNAHQISMYSDIAFTWVSSDRGALVSWSPHVDSNYVILQGQLQAPQPFGELNEHATDSTMYYAMKASPKTTWQISFADTMRQTFVSGTSLPNTADGSNLFRTVLTQLPALAIATDFGSVTSTPEPAVWSIGVIRDPVVQYRAWNGNIENRRSYYQSAFGSTLIATQMFVDDFDNALKAADALDAQILADGQRFSSDYSDLLRLSLLQAMGGIDLTLSQAVDGSWNGSDIKAFMKNMGNIGATTTTGVNAVDVLYAAFPMYMYLNPDLGGYLLKPLLEYQNTDMYTLPYAALNIGSQYPNATADLLNQTHQLGVEQSANMLIMTLAHAQGSGNGTLISKHYTLLRGWADYLVQSSLTPISQLSPDKLSISTNNQTNIALKGIIGIAAMGKISLYAGVKDDANNYTTVAQNYMKQWAQLAKSSDGTHLLMTYGDQSSSGLMYNLYADKLLQLNLVPPEIYDIQTNFYGKQASANPSEKFGLSLDNVDSSSTRIDWMMFSAATVTNSITRDSMVTQLHLTAQNNASNLPWCVSYNPSDTTCLSGQNSPAIGAMFSLLALNQTIKPVSIPTDGSTIPGLKPSKSSTGVIVGAVIGGIALVAVLGVAVFFLRRRRRQMHRYSINLDGQPQSSYSDKEPSVPLHPFAYGAIHDQGSETLVHDVDAASSDNLQGPLTFVGTRDAYNVRSESYFRSGEDTVVGPSVSEAGRPEKPPIELEPHQLINPHEYPPSSTSSHPAVYPAPSHVQELRSEVDDLRRELERVKQERGLEEAPPLYSDNL